MSECMHGLPEESCALCKPDAERPGVRRPRQDDRKDYFANPTYNFLDTDRPIYAAGSGYRAHYDEHCHGFTYGAAERVGEISRSEARRRRLADCEMCVTPWHQREGD